MFDILPNSPEAEKSYLGAILNQPDLIFDVAIEPIDMYYEYHQDILKFMIYLSDIGEPIELIKIGEIAGAEGLEKIGGYPYLMELNTWSFAGSFESNQEIIRSKSILRKSIETMRRKSSEAGLASNVGEYLSDAMDALKSILDSVKSNKVIRRLSETAMKHLDLLHKRKTDKGMTGAKSSCSALNRLMGGYQNGELIITGARPSIGKTAFALNEAETAASDYLKRGVKGCVAIFSLEMDDLPLYERMIALIGNLPIQLMKNPEEMTPSDWERYEMARLRIAKLPLYIDDSVGQSLRSIEKGIKHLTKEYDEVFILIDFLQLIDAGKKTNKEHEGVAYVSKMLKQFARRYNCPINAISAVSRDCEKRQDKRPMMSDLRESGSIESDADIVLFLYRDDYYNAKSDKVGITEIIIAKGRNIGTGLVEMGYKRDTSKFYNLDF